MTSDRRKNSIVVEKNLGEYYILPAKSSINYRQYKSPQKIQFLNFISAILSARELSSEAEKSDNLEQTSNRSIKVDSIDEVNKLSTFEEILEYGSNTIKLKDEFFLNRIRELKELCDSEEDYDVSLESLKAMLLFVGAMGSFSKPSITVSESGIFYLEWEKDKNNSITLRFKQDYFIDYVIFKPSLHANKRIILNGSMHALDLIDYLNDLNINIHKTSQQ